MHLCSSKRDLSLPLKVALSLGPSTISVSISLIDLNLHLPADNSKVKLESGLIPTGNIKNTCASANLIAPNITCTNGPVHIIDNLLGFVYNDGITELKENYKYRFVFNVQFLLMYSLAISAA